MEYGSVEAGFIAVIAVSGSIVFIAREVHKRLLSDFMKKIEIEIEMGGNINGSEKCQMKRRVRFAEDVIEPSSNNKEYRKRNHVKLIGDDHVNKRYSTMASSLSSDGSSARKTFEVGPIWDYDGASVICKCNDKCPMRITWIKYNIGIRFFSCPNYKREDGGCNFFQWVDEPLFQSERARSLVMELENDGVQLRNVTKQNNTDSIIDQLKAEISELKSENKKLMQKEYTLAMEIVDYYGKKNAKTFVLMIFSWMISVFLFICLIVK